MTRKPFLIGITAIIASLLILLPIERMNRTNQVKPAEQDQVAGITPVSYTGQVPDKEEQRSPAVDEPLFPSLKVRASLTDSGFSLAFDKEQYPILEKTVSAADRVVHSVKRSDYKEDGSSITWTRQDAVIVNPETREVKTYPLYELKTLLPGDGGLFTMIDDRNVMFVRPTLEGERVSYDLARMDIETGKIVEIAARFWESELVDHLQVDDFLISSHYSERSDAYGKLLLTSAKGRLWQFDVASGEARSNGEEAYPAYGDLGSKPYRELVYPSPDLKRFVYQHLDANRFEVINADSGERIHEFGFDETVALMDPGIVWSPDNGMFFLESGNLDQALGVYTDNGMLMFAQKIAFYDRDGRVIRTLELPQSKDKRMNVYGWVDDGKVWIEYFRANRPEDRDSSKQDVAYKLYDINTGRFTDYKVTEDITKLNNPVLVKKHGGYSFLSPPFLIADSANRVLWLPSKETTATWNDEQVYGQLTSEDNSFEYRWDPSGRTWEWINADPGEIKNGERQFVRPAVHQNQWLIYPRNSVASFDYVKIAATLERNADGLPVLTGELTEKTMGTQEWWKDDHFSKTEEQSPTIRASGKSRFGTLKLKSLPGEVRLEDGGGFRYYGTYAVEYTNRQGANKPLPSIDVLALRVEGSSPSLMRVFEFKDFDILLFQPDSFRFSKSFDGGIRDIRAYAITKQGNAFPLTFQYVHGTQGQGMQSALTIPIDDNAAVETIGDNLVLHAWLGERNFELALKPNLKDKTLTVADAIDRTGEYAELAKVTNRYANRLEQALGLEDIDLPEGKMDDEQLRALFTDKAWSNPGFQHLKKDFAKSKQKGNSSRAFAWNPIDARFVSPDTIRFTFALNLWYAIGLAAHLEVGLKLEDGKWRFHDLGTLETEKLEGLPGYNGLLIRDPLELIN